MRRFPPNDIMSLVGPNPRYELAESVGPDLRLHDLLDDTDLPLSYGSAAGDPRLRTVIARSHGVDPDDVVLTSGGMHALFLLAFLLCEQGDQAVTTAPLFPIARGSLDAVGADVRVVPLSFDGGYQLDLDALAGQLTAATKLVSLATPQNPSGVALSPRTLEAVVALVKETSPDAYILIDETYREATYGDALVAPSAVTLDPRVVSVASLSKCHGAPGLRVGWAISRDRTLVEQLIHAKFGTVLTGSPVTEALALRVFEKYDQIMAERRVVLADGLAATEAWVADNADLVDWVRPDAGAICCVRLKPAVFDAEGVERFYRTLENHQVRVANGSWFADEPRVFRLGFGFLPAAELKAALDAFTVALRS